MEDAPDFELGQVQSSPCILDGVMSASLYLAVEEALRKQAQLWSEWGSLHNRHDMWPTCVMHGAVAVPL